MAKRNTNKANAKIKQQQHKRGLNQNLATEQPTQLPATPETPGNAAQTVNQPKTKNERWRGYDAASKGGAGFDGKDLKHLVKKGWSNNDIMKAAVAAGRVNKVADRQLALLGTKESRYSPFKKDGFRAPSEVFWSSFDLFGEGASDTDSRMNRVRFLGGDPNKAKNWIVAGTDRDKASAQSPDYYGSLGNDAGMSWYRPGTKWRDDKGKSQEVLTWGGLDGEGRGLALNGIEIKGDGKNFNRQNRSTSWALPKDLVDQQFADRVNAVTGGETGKDESVGAGEEEKPEALQPYTGPSLGADYGTYTYEMDNDTPLFDQFTKRFAAADAFKRRIGLG